MSDRHYSVLYMTTGGRVTRVTRDEAGMLREVRAASRRDLMERIEITRSDADDDSDLIFTGDDGDA